MRGRLLSSVLAKAVRDSLQWTVGAVIALWLLSALMVGVMGSFGDEYINIMADLPEAMANIYGDNDGTAEGLAMSSMFSLMGPLVLLAFAIGLGSSAAVGEEEARTLPLLLANPVGRSAVLMAKAVVVVANVAIILALMWLGILAFGAVFDLDLSNQNVLAATVQLGGLALLFGGLALAVSAWRGSSALGIGVAAGLAVASYFVTTLLPVVEELADVARLTPWYLYTGASSLANGIDFVLLAIAVGLGAVMLWVGTHTIERRDLKG